MALIKAQISAGHDVTLAIDTARSGDLLSRLSSEHLPVWADMSLSVKAGINRQVRDFLQLRDVWRSERYDIIHCHKSHEHTLAVLSRVPSSKTRLVRTLNKGVVLGVMRNALLGRTDGLLTVARTDRQKLVSTGLATKARVEVLGGVVDPGLFSPGRGAVLRDHLGIGKRVMVAGLVSRIKKGRGHSLLLEAWELVHEKLPEAHLVISGRGEWSDKISSMARDTRFGKTVHVIGYQQDLVGLYRSLDVSVMLAPGNDGTCRAALQAMACAKPLVASDVGALADIVLQGRTGLLCRANQKYDLADALVELLSKRDKSAQMGVAARQRVEKFYTIERHFQVVESFYNRIVGSDGVVA